MLSATLTEKLSLPDSGSLNFIENYITIKDYQTVAYLLLLYADYLQGINASLVPQDPGSQIFMLMRDENKTQDQPNFAADNPKVLANRMLQRALATLRGVDHVLSAIYTDNKVFYEDINKILNKLFKKLFKDAHHAPFDYVSLHEDFNSTLIEILNVTGLDIGLTKSSDYKKLLRHFRALASCLDPAKIICTTQEFTVGDHTIKRVETAFPITQKTAAQKQQLAVLKTTLEKPARTERNYHTHKLSAFQNIEAAFADLIADDTRQLSAPNVKIIAPTLKNAYICQEKISLLNAAKEVLEEKTFWNIRTASPVYSGNGETKINLNAYTAENFQQLKNAVRNFSEDPMLKNFRKFHFILLLKPNNNIIKQSRMSDIAKQQWENLGGYWSLAPLNIEGNLSARPQISGLVRRQVKPEDHLGINTPSLTTKHLIDKAANIINLASADEHCINITACFNGEDHTTVVLLAANKKRLQNLFSKHAIKLESDTLESYLLRTRHAVLLPHLTTSIAHDLNPTARHGHYFSERTNEYIFRMGKSNFMPIKINTAEQFVEFNWMLVKKTELESSLQKVLQAAQEDEKTTQLQTLLKDCQAFKPAAYYITAFRKLLEYDQKELIKLTPQSTANKISLFFTGPSYHKQLDNLIKAVRAFEEKYVVVEEEKPTLSPGQV